MGDVSHRERRNMLQASSVRVHKWAAVYSIQVNDEWVSTSTCRMSKAEWNNTSASCSLIRIHYILINSTSQLKIWHFKVSKNKIPLLLLRYYLVCTVIKVSRSDHWIMWPLCLKQYTDCTTVLRFAFSVKPRSKPACCCVQPKPLNSTKSTIFAKQCTICTGSDETGD